MPDQRIARLGGLARVERSGNPGTPEGRRLGGLRSQLTHIRRKTKFQTLQPARKPKRSARLAEFMGILAGDGHVGTYQISVVTSAETDEEHAFYVRDLMISLFSLPVSLTRRRTSNAYIVLLSSKHASQLVTAFGMSVGNKVVQQITPPDWILERKSYSRAYLRGLIDTDGCVYEDRHTVKGRSYSSTCISFTNASKPLLDFVENIWSQEGFTPTRSGRDVRLRRREDVLKYFEVVGFHNSKHANKIRV